MQSRNVFVFPMKEAGREVQTRCDVEEAGDDHGQVGLPAGQFEATRAQHCLQGSTLAELHQHPCLHVLLHPAGRQTVHHFCYCYYYMPFLPQEARCICRQAACALLHNMIMFGAGRVRHRSLFGHLLVVQLRERQIAQQLLKESLLILMETRFCRLLSLRQAVMCWQFPLALLHTYQ